MLLCLRAESGVFGGFGANGAAPRKMRRSMMPSFEYSYFTIHANRSDRVESMISETGALHEKVK
jgi:hypothetical protein